MRRIFAGRLQRGARAYRWARLSLLMATGASAQAPDVAGRTAPEASPCAVPAASATGTRAQEIEALYQQFECHFSRHEYEECLPYLEQACRLSSSTACLLNLGAVHHALMHCALARHYYELFLDRAPYDDDGGDAKKALHEIHAACPGHEAARPPSPLHDTRVDPSIPPPPGPSSLDRAEPPLPDSEVAPSSTASDPVIPGGVLAGTRVEGITAGGIADAPSTQRTLTWLLLGGGVTTAVSAAITASYAMRAESDFNARARHNGGLGLSSDTELRAIDRRGQNYNQLTIGFGVASGLLLGAGATLLLFDVADGTRLSISGGAAPGIDYRRRF